MAIDRVVDPHPSHLSERGFLVGRTALVTGGAKRIGRQLALALAKEGADVVIHYRNSLEKAQETVALLRASGARADLVVGDLAKAEVAESLVSKSAEIMNQPIDILLNNASIFEQGGVLNTSGEQWEKHQAVNLRAPYLLSRSFAAQGQNAQQCDIINLNDFRAVRPGSDHFAYTNSKVGLHGLTSSLALALAPGIRVNELALGPVLSPEKAPEDYQHTLRDQIPTGKFPTVDQVCHGMLFLLANGAVTGQTLFIDGGRHLGDSL